MRKTKDVVIDRINCPNAERDWDKMFRITEMPAFQAERWATRATLALLPRLSREADEEIVAQIRSNPGMLPMQRVALLLGSINFPETTELMEEIISSCVQIVPDPSRPLPRAIGAGGSEDIEEVQTIAFLRQEAMNLHTNFTLVAAILNLISVASRMSPSEITSTSPPPSES